MYLEVVDWCLSQQLLSLYSFAAFPSRLVIMVLRV